MLRESWESRNWTLFQGAYTMTITTITTIMAITAMHEGSVQEQLCIGIIQGSGFATRLCSIEIYMA